jgi:DNA-directed RNA polymerase subunit L
MTLHNVIITSFKPEDIQTAIHAYPVKHPTTGHKNIRIYYCRGYLILETIQIDEWAIS